MITAREILSEGLEGVPESDGHNLLVISDLHLGDSLRPSDPGFVKELARLNRALCRFLKHYQRHRADERPWRLVIAGDMIDFLHAGLYGERGEAHGHERALNHCSEADAIAYLEEVMTHERRVFRLLASFVGAGHDLVIIKGNHDAQFHFEGVQRRFAEILLAIQARRLLVRRKSGRENALQEMADFTQRIHFCRWFYYERDVVYIEHGNQYDAFCSFEHVLSPVDHDLYELEDPISHRTYRAFANFLRSINVHLCDTWTLKDYALWIVGLGPTIIAQLAYTYFASISWLVHTQRRLIKATRRARDEHLERRKKLEARFGLSDDVLNALDEMRERPAGNSLLSGIRMLYMDRVGLMLLNLVVFAALLVMPGSIVARLAIGLGVVLASVFANHFMDRAREVDPHPKLMRISRKVARLLKVPFVVFGHSHRPLMAEASEADAAAHARAWYFNTGSWTSGQEGLTHVCILRHEKRSIRAELRKWCTKSHKPETLHFAS